MSSLTDFVATCEICERSLSECKCMRCPVCRLARSPYCVERHAPRSFWQDCKIEALPAHARDWHDDVVSLAYWYDALSRRWLPTPLNSANAQRLHELAMLRERNVITCRVDLNPAHSIAVKCARTQQVNDSAHVQASFL